MTETQKSWEITVTTSSKKCKHRIHKPDLTDGKYNNFGGYMCGFHDPPIMRCFIADNCPLRSVVDYPMTPKNQVNIEDI